MGGNAGDSLVVYQASCLPSMLLLTLHRVSPLSLPDLAVVLLPREVLSPIPQPSSSPDSEPLLWD